MQDDDSHLKSLYITGKGASTVDWAFLAPELLGKVLVSLEEGIVSVTIRRSYKGPTVYLTVGPRKPNRLNIDFLSPNFVSSLFKTVAESPVMNIRRLNLASSGKLKIPQIPPELLSQAMTKLEIFRAQGGILTVDQISTVFTRLSGVDERKLKFLSLQDNDLSSFPAEILLAEISGMEEVNLAGTQLTTEQLTGIFTGLSALEYHKLKTLNLSANNLSSVSTDILVAGTSGLEEWGGPS